MTFNMTDNYIFDSYNNLVDGLSAYLGEGYEFILYKFNGVHYSINKIANGKYNTVKEGDIITDFDLALINKLENDADRDFISYFNRNKLGEPLKSTDIVIRGVDNKIIGLLCIHFYLNTPLTRIIGSYIPEHNAMQSAPVLENIVEDTDEIILKSYQDAKVIVENDSNISSNDKNKSIVSILNESGIFKIKDSVVKVADLMGLSKNTVYMHLRNLNKN